MGYFANIPKMAKNGQKWQKWPKMAKNGKNAKNTKMCTLYAYRKSGYHSAFFVAWLASLGPPPKIYIYPNADFPIHTYRQNGFYPF